MSRRRRWGFRARLTVLIAGVFIGGGVVMLGVQFLLVQQLFSQGISTVTAGCTTGELDRMQGGGSSSHEDLLKELCHLETAEDGQVTWDGGGVGAVLVAQSTQLSHEVLSGLLIWSLVILGVFACLAVIAARWLSKRSLGRIARITETTRAITRDDLHRRLDLPGPDDEVKELGDTIDGMLDRLDDAFTRQDRFIAGASHELRTPLTTTRTLLEIPLSQGRVPTELEPAIHGALAASERSERVIAALLTLARLRHPRPATAEAARADLREIAMETLAEYEQAIADRGLAMKRPGPGAATVIADTELLRIAIGNLVDNAIRHNREAGELVVRTDADPASAWVDVINDGIDLTHTDVTAFIEPFHRGENTRLAGEGLGLGLALVETIARSYGGSLVLTPRPGGGLHARFCLPRRAERDG